MLSKKSVYNRGLYIGYGIADCNKSMLQSMDVDDFVDEIIETESCHYRCFSPFEFFASDINKSDDPDFLWDQYESGVHDGIMIFLHDMRHELSQIDSESNS